MATKALEQHDLEDDSNIARPAENHTKYEVWRQLSKAVSAWLVNIIHEDI
jgi:hypothetical protein